MANMEAARDVQITKLLAEYGIQSKKAGVNEIKIVCPSPDHADSDASCYINTAKNIFHCHGCSATGSAIDFVAMVEGCSISRAAEILTGESKGEGPVKDVAKQVAAKPKHKPAPEYKTAQYDYCDESGNKLYSAVRYDYPDGTKEFRLCSNSNGNLSPGLDQGVRRVPYRLDLFSRHSEVFFAEGEKCAESLSSLGVFCSCIAGGAKAKIDQIIGCFEGKDVILLPDNDDTGREFMNGMAKALWDVARSVRIINVATPRDPKGYDIADKIKDWEKAGLTKKQMFEEIDLMKRAALYVCDGEIVHAMTAEQQEAHYQMMLRLDGFDLAEFIPQFKGRVRPLVRGDCVAIVGGTGSGKTAFLQAVSQWARPRVILNFNMELSVGVMFERSVSIGSAMKGVKVEEAYLKGNKPGTDSISHIYTVPISRLTTETITKQFHLFIKMFKVWPDVVMIDYLQLLKGRGPIYERMTGNAEEMRILAKDLDTILFFSSQKSRPPQQKRGQECQPTLNDAKDSGAIENSCSLYIDLRPHSTHTNVKVGTVLKNSRGDAGFEFEIKWDGSCTRFIPGAVSDLDTFKAGEEDSYVPF